jgi:hypothetical protein
MVIITLQGSSGSVVRFASFLPFATLVRDSVERKFEDACPCHAQCAPAVAATLPPPADDAPATVRTYEVTYYERQDPGPWYTTRVLASSEAHARDVFITQAEAGFEFLAADPVAG